MYEHCPTLLFFKNFFLTVGSGIKIGISYSYYMTRYLLFLPHAHIDRHVETCCIYTHTCMYMYVHVCIYTRIHEMLSILLCIY